MGTLQNPDALIPKEVSAALFAVEARCMQAIQTAVEQQMGQSGGGTSSFGGYVDSQSSGMPAMPFMAFWDVEKSTWDMYLPSGSLIVDGKSVEINKPGSIGAGKKYLHVNTSKTPVEASIDGSAVKSGCDYDIPLFEIETDGGGYAVVKTQWQYGTVLIGSPNSNGCFDPKYDEQGSITGVLRPYVMCGREVVTASGTPTDGVNVVRVKHENDSVTASIESGDSATPENSSDTYTDIPLYKIKDNKIVEDYRNMPRVPLYDSRRLGGGKQT